MGMVATAAMGVPSLLCYGHGGNGGPMLHIDQHIVQVASTTMTPSFDSKSLEQDLKGFITR